MSFAIAYMCAYNEADIIRWAALHLLDQGLHVHVIDCWSSDGTIDTLKYLPLTIERFPHAGPAARVSWRDLLTRVEDLAAHSPHTWCALNDADEFRLTDRPGETLIEGLQRIEAAGYTAVDHDVLTFPPVDNGYDGKQDPQQYFECYEPDRLNSAIGQVKAWRNLGRVSLASSGGHQARFGGRKVYPYHWLSKHIPIRSQQHGERKVFCERRNRWADPEADWHVQYKHVRASHNFLRKPDNLRRWSLDAAA